MTDILGYDDDAVSILFEEVAPNDWAERFHKPDILGRWNDLAKQPGCGANPWDQRRPKFLEEAFLLPNGVIIPNRAWHVAESN